MAHRMSSVVDAEARVRHRLLPRNQPADVTDVESVVVHSASYLLDSVTNYSLLAFVAYFLFGPR